MRAWESRMSRRAFLGTAAGAALAAQPLARSALAASAKLPSPARSGLDHVVLVVMENRSFDHFLGWLPGANGAQDTTTPRYPDAAGRRHPNHHLTDPRGCGEPDPDHSYHGGRFQLHGGAMDNFARRDDFRAIG